jgi:biopolymer transport protein ExbB
MKHRTWIVLALVVCALWTAAPDVRAQADEGAAAAPSAAKKMTLWDLIVVGGWAMWPLGGCSFALVALAVMNYRQLAAAKMMPPEALAQIRAAAREQDLQKTWEAAGATKSLFTNALAVGLRHLDLADIEASKPKAEAAIAEAVGREESTASYWINFLSLITAISPMLGLLGTVSGMIGAFQKIAGGGMGKPELLAGNIGEALITTAAGLIIAIPSMFFYFLFRNKLNSIIQRAEEQYSMVLDDLTGTGLSVEEEPPAAAPAAPAPKA